MAYNIAMAERVRQELAMLAAGGAQERRMFGSLGFMCSGKLALCVRQDNVMYKLDATRCAELVSAGVAQPVIMRNRQMKNWVFVPNELLGTAGQLRSFIEESLAYVQQKSRV